MGEHGEVLLEQDDVGALLGDVDGGVNGDAAVARAHGGGVVDAVAHEADGFSAALAQHTHDARLLQGGELGEQPRVLGALGELLVAEHVDLGAGKHVPGVDAHLLAHGRRHGGVVPGEDLDGHPQAGELIDRRLGAGLGRVEEREVADERHVALVVGGEVARGHVVSLGDAHHAHAALVQAAHAVEDPLRLLGREREDIGAHLDLAADVDHLLDGALGDELALARPVGDHHAHATAVEVEGDLVHESPLLARSGDGIGLGRGALRGGGGGARAGLTGCPGRGASGPRVHAPTARRQRLGTLDDGLVHEVAQARLEQAVEVGVAQHAVAGRAEHVEMALEHDLVAREGAGLVAAQHVHRAEVLDGGDLLDHDVLRAHGLGAARQARRHDDGQHLRGDPHGDGD